MNQMVNAINELGDAAREASEAMNDMSTSVRIAAAPVYCPCGQEMKLSQYCNMDWHPSYYDPDSGGEPLWQYECECGWSAPPKRTPDEAYAAAMKRVDAPNEPNEPLTLDDFDFAPPTVIWIEVRGRDDMYAAVCGTDGVYEVSNGYGWEDNAEFRGYEYGTGFRVWSGLFHGKPTDAERAAAPWKE